MAEAPRPPEASCGRNDQLTNRIEDSDGEHARSAARMRRKTASRPGGAPPLSESMERSAAIVLFRAKKRPALTCAKRQGG